MRARIAPVVLVVVAVLCAGVAVWPELSGSSTPTASTSASTPVFSARRVPGLLARAVADTKLSAALQRLTEDPALGPGKDQTCLSVRDASGRVLYAKNTSAPLIPASNMKLLTGSAAVERLGAGYRYTTELRAAGAPAGDGVLRGDLWLVGGGDPLLGTADFGAVAGYQRRPRLTTSLEKLADQAVAAGVRQVEGRVVGDESRYDNQRYVPTWNPSYIRDSEIGPLSALSVNAGFVSWQPPILAASDPAGNAAAVLTSLLRARGVTVGADATSGRAPDGSALVTSLESEPLVEVVGVMLRESDNQAAELMVKELGVRFGGAGTTEAGIGVIRSTFSSGGSNGTAFAAADGSGLDRSDRLSCDLLQETLSRGGDQGPVAQELPVAGRDGTMARRFVGTPAEGKVRAKTGSLRGVMGLSGWATGSDGRQVQFSLLANELPRDALGTGLETGVANELVAYPQMPDPAQLAPLPVEPAITPG